MKAENKTFKGKQLSGFLIERRGKTNFIKSTYLDGYQMTFWVFDFCVFNYKLERVQ